MFFYAVCKGTHHFIARYFLQTGWLRSSMRLYWTMACRRSSTLLLMVRNGVDD